MIFNKKIKLLSILLTMSIAFGMVGCYRGIKTSDEYIYISLENEDNTYQGVTYKDEKVISFSYDYNEGQNMEVEIRQLGANRLPNIGNLYLVDKSGETNDKKELYLEMFSDLLMPYKVYAKSNSLNTRTESQLTWTGGWHGANGSTFDLPSSAVNTKFNLYIDGEKIEETKTELIKCKEAVIVIENLICGYNTVDLISGYYGNSRAIVKESIELTLTKGNIKVSNEVEALEDIIMKTMYGLALNINPQKENISIQYIGTDDKVLEPIISNDESIYIHNSGAKNRTNTCTSIKATDQDTLDVMEVYIDTNIGIGNFEYISDETPMAFTTAYKKIYYNLVNGKRLEMKKGDKLRFEGGWNIYNEKYIDDK